MTLIKKSVKLLNIPPSSNHIHFGIYDDEFGATEGTYPFWLHGYLSENDWPGKYIDPIDFIEAYQTAQPNLKWNFETNDALSSPVIGEDGVIYVVSTDGWYDFKFYAKNPDGSEKWSFGDDFGWHDYEGFYLSIGNDGTIYMVDSSEGLYAINTDGELEWSFDMEGASFASPVAVGGDGTIYLAGRNDNLYALTPDGTLKWTYECEYGFSHKSPVIGSDGTIYGISFGDILTALSPDGTLEWTTSEIDASFSSSPAIGSDGTIYCASWGANLYAVNPNGTLKWQFEPEEDVTFYSTSPVIGTDGTIYFGCLDSYDEGYFYTVNSKGELKWNFKTEGGIYGTPIIGNDGIIYFGCADGNLYAFNTDGDLQWTYETGSVYQSPTMGNDGTIYIPTSSGILYAINSSSTGPATSSWPIMGANAQHTHRVPISVIPIQEHNETINEGETHWYDFFNNVLQDIWVVLGFGSEFNLRVYQPDGTLYQEEQSTTSPIKVFIPGAQVGQWQFEITALETPIPDDPYVLTISVADMDEDGIPDAQDNCPNIYNPDQTDSDGIGDLCDNCTMIANSDQQDEDNDGFGNICDCDLNNDCKVDSTDFVLFRAVFFSNDVNADFNSDGIVNTVDLRLFYSGWMKSPGPSGLISCE